MNLLTGVLGQAYTQRKAWQAYILPESFLASSKAL